MHLKSVITTSTILLFCLMMPGVAFAQQKQVCQPSEALLNGVCVPKADCPAGLNEAQTDCAPIPVCEKGTFWSEGKKACEKEPTCGKTEALLDGKCIYKTKCPAGLNKENTHCAAVPECEEGTHWIKPRRQCMEFGKECGKGMVWAPEKNRCAVKGARCGQGLRWVDAKNRCVVKGTECGKGLVWMTSKNRCVVKGTECPVDGMVWNPELERCVVSLPGNPLTVPNR